MKLLYYLILYSLSLHSHPYGIRSCKFPHPVCAVRSRKDLLKKTTVGMSMRRSADINHNRRNKRAGIFNIYTLYYIMLYILNIITYLLL